MRELTNGLYDMAIARRQDLDLIQGIFVNFPKLKSWTMNDLYSRHPDPHKPYLWKYEGRKDDVIVLSNSEKIQPVEMETVIAHDPRVAGALIVGQGQPQAAALVELNGSPLNTPQREATLDSLMGVIDEANTKAPGYAQIDKSHVIFTTPQKPMARLNKGNINRRDTTRSYEKEIHDLYEPNGGDNRSGNAVAADMSSSESIKDWLKRLISKAIKIEHVAEDDDFFEIGIDSLQAMVITREMKASMRGAALKEELIDEFSTSDVYMNPTITSLAAHVSDMFHLERSVVNNSVDNMQQLFDRYMKSLPPKSALLRTAPTQPESYVVMLTGSTGSLGSYILDSICNTSSIVKVYCLNRSADAAERQVSIQSERGLRMPKLDSISFLHADLSKPLLGLTEDDYNQLLREVTHIIRE